MTDRKRTDFQRRNVLKLGLTGQATTQLAPSAYDGRGNKGILRGATVEDLPAMNAVVTAAVRAWDSPGRVLRLALPGERLCANGGGRRVVDRVGVRVNPLTRAFSIVQELSVNFMVYATREAAA